MKTEQPSFLQFSRLTFSQTLSEIKPRKPLFPYLPFTQLSFAKKAILSLLSSPPSPSLPPFVPIARAFRSTAKKRSFQKSKGNTPEARDTRSTPTYPYGKFLFYSLRWRARTPRFPAENTWHTRRDTHALAHTRARSPLLSFHPSPFSLHASRSLRFGEHSCRSVDKRRPRQFNPPSN